jgi:hypothetical protein
MANRQSRASDVLDAPPGAIVVTLPIRLHNPLNGSHGHWSKKAKERQEHRWFSALTVRSRLSVLGRPLAVGGQFVITLTRISPKPFDDDGLAAACKGIRDGIADALGRDDGPKSGLTWKYEQKRGAVREHAVRIQIEREESDA